MEIRHGISVDVTPPGRSHRAPAAPQSDGNTSANAEPEPYIDFVPMAQRHANSSPAASQNVGGTVASARRSGKSHYEEVQLPRSDSQPAPHSASKSFDYIRLARETLKAAGVENPDAVLVKIYRQNLGRETGFDLQVRSAERRHNADTGRHAYLQAAFDISGGDQQKFHTLITAGHTEASRNLLGGQTYARYAAQIEPFVGPTPAEYLDRFSHLPQEIHEKVSKDAVAFALDRAFGVEPA